MKVYPRVQARGRNLHGLVLLMAAVAVAACATSGHEGKRVCAFENTQSGECVVDFVCRQKDPALCDVVVEYLKTRELAKTAAPSPLPGGGETNVACDNSPILCTCCSVRAGCYPCPKE